MEYIAFDASVARADGRPVREQRLTHERGAFQQFLARCEPGSPVALETVGNWYWIVDEIEAARVKTPFPDKRTPYKERTCPSGSYGTTNGSLYSRTGRAIRMSGRTDWRTGPGDSADSSVSTRHAPRRSSARELPRQGRTPSTRTTRPSSRSRRTVRLKVALDASTSAVSRGW